MIYITLFYEFFKIGLFAIGGGLATLPFLYDLSERYPWITTDSIADMVAISQSTPGPLGINMSTYAGYQGGGLLGGIIATIGLITPSIIVIIIIAHILNKFKESPYVESVFYGLRPAVTGLIAAAGFAVFKITILNMSKFNITNKLLDIINYKATLLLIGIFVIMKYFKKHPIFYLFLGALAGILFKI